MTQEFVTLPREVVGQALEAMKWAFPNSIRLTADHRNSIDSLSAALERPQDHVPDAGNMASAGWKLVPVEPTREMIEAGKDAHYEAEKRIQEPGAWKQGGFAKRAVRAAHVFQAMLAAAPQPPTVKECLTVEQPQANQPAMTPIAQRKLDSLLAEGYTISGYSVYHERKHQHGFVTGAGLVGWWKPEGMEYPQPLEGQEPFTVLVRKCSWLANQWEAAPRGFPDYGRSWADERVNVYTHPQPKREPLTDEQIDAIADAMPGGLEGFMKGWGWRQFARAVIEATHNIK